MAISTVTIANRTLQKLGARRIAALDDVNDPNARSINNAYDTVLTAELRRYAWSFAISRASIAADATDSLWGGWNRFRLPNDFIRLIRDDESGFQVDFKIEGNFILSANASPLEIRYIAKIDDPNLYDSLFIESFASKLGIECCTEITQRSTAKQDLKEDYAFAINEAKRVGSIEKEAQNFPEDEWITVRF